MKRLMFWAVIGVVQAMLAYASTPGLYDNQIDRAFASSQGTGGALDLTAPADSIRCTLIDDTDYTANFATDIDYADVAAGAKVGESGALDTVTFSGGVMDAADETIASVSGDGVESTLLYDYNATAGLAELVVLLDNGGTTTPNGNDINVVFDSGANKIFSVT